MLESGPTGTGDPKLDELRGEVRKEGMSASAKEEGHDPKAVERDEGDDQYSEQGRQDNVN